MVVEILQSTITPLGSQPQQLQPLFTSTELENAVRQNPSIFTETLPEEGIHKEAYYKTQSGLILHIKYNSDRLESDGHSRAYFDIECFDAEGNRLSNKQMCDELGFNLTSEYIDFNGLISFKNEKLNIKIPGKVLQQAPANKAQIETTALFEKRFNQANAAFEEQLKQDGWPGDVADGVSVLWFSDNRASKVREDIKITSKQLKDLQAALQEGDAAFRAKFKEIFGVEYNQDNIKNFQNVEKMYLEASEAKAQEDDLKNEFSLLLNGKPLSDEKLGRDANGEEWRLSKEDVYKREYNKLAKMIGEQPLNLLMQLSVNENASVDEKYKVLQSFVNITMKSLKDKTVAFGGGREFEDLQNLYNNTYKNAFGENDILKRVYDYNESQQKGAGVVKTVTVTAATIAAGFISGGLAVPLVAGVSTAATEVTDRATSGEALDSLRENGIIGWLEKTGEITDWKNVAIASLSSTAMTVMFMGQSYAVTNLCLNSGKSLTTAMAADLVAGAATGAGVEYLMTGEISVEGQLFLVAMSLLGGAISIKSIKKAGRVQETQPQKPNFGLQEPPKKVVTENDQINHVNVPDEGVPRAREVANQTKPTFGLQEPPKKVVTENDQINHVNSPDEGVPRVREVANQTRLEDIKKLKELFNSPERTKFSDPAALEKNIESVLALVDKYPDIPKDIILNLANNPNISVQVINGKVRFNGFEKVIELCSQHPEHKLELLATIGNKKYSFSELRDIMEQPNFKELLDIVGSHHALNNLSDGITAVGFEKYEALNNLLYGKPKPEHQHIKRMMKEKYGVDLHIDNNIDAKSALEYSKSVETLINRYKESGKKPPQNIYITNICPEGSNGVAWAKKYPNSIAVTPSDNPDWFMHCLYHESAHLTDMVNKRVDLQYKPVGTKLGLVDGKIASLYDESYGIEMRKHARKYVSDYAAYDTNEFSAEFSAMLLEKKIVIEDIQLPGGNIETKIHIKEPFVNADGKIIEITPEVRADIETLVDYYFSIGGQNFKI